jgi:hypothetical protein
MSSPTPEEKRERVYDTEIAPLLREAGKTAEKHGIPFLAVAEWNTDKVGRTQAGGNGCAAMRMTIAAALAHGNLDAMVISVAKWAGKNHNSMILTMLERKETP